MTDKCYNDRSKFCEHCDRERADAARLAWLDAKVAAGYWISVMPPDAESGKEIRRVNVRFDVSDFTEAPLRDERIAGEHCNENHPSLRDAIDAAIAAEVK